MSINFLEINNATFVASKKNKVLDFNLTIKNEGDIICLLGPSGVSNPQPPVLETGTLPNELLA